MKNLHRVLAAAFIGLLISGCSGGKGATTVPATGGSQSVAPASKTQTTSLTMQIPKSIATQSKKTRTPQYVSASTLGVAVWVFVPPATQPATPTALADFSATSPACTAGSNGARTCTITIPAPIGANDTFVVSTYDQVPAGGLPQGNVLSTNTITGVSIVAGQVNTVPLTLNGVPVTIVINPPAVAVPAGQPSSFTINVNAKDVDGNYIIGTGSYTNAISLAITGDPNTTLSLSSTSVAAPSGSAITVNFNGGSLGTGTITATAGGATSAHTTVTASNAISQVTFTIPGFSSEAVYVALGATISRYASNATGAATPTFQINGGVPVGVAVDAAFEYVIATNGSIEFFPVGATAGPPSKTLSGTNTLLCNPEGIAVYNGTLYISDSCNGILEWPTSTPGGNVAPVQISGGATGLTGGQIAVNAGGIYAANRGANHSVEKFALNATGNASPVFTINPGAGSFDTAFGPQGIAVDAGGNVYVASVGSNNNVVVFAPGATTASYTITGNNTFCSPQGIALDGLGHLWVSNDCYGTNPNADVVQAFNIGAANATNSPVVTFGGLPNVSFSLVGCCSSIAVDPSNDVYAANQTANTVTRWTSAGTLVSTLANGPNGAPSNPEGMTFDTAGNLYQVNSSAGSTSVFAPGQTAAARTFFPTQNDGCPIGIAVDTAGHEFVSDRCANAVTEFPANANGAATPITTLHGGGASGISTPYQIAFDFGGNLYVANSGNNTITVYGNGLIGNGTPSATLGGASTLISSPTGVAVDTAGYIYVLNNNPSSVTVYPPGASGNVPPVRTIATNPNASGQIAVDPYQDVYINSSGGFLVYGPTSTGPTANIRVTAPGSGVGIAISPTQP